MSRTCRVVAVAVPRSMMRGGRVALMTLAALAGTVSCAMPTARAPLWTPAYDARDRVRWLPQAVRYPVDPDEVTSSVPFAAGGEPPSADVSGEIVVSTDRAATLWLDPLTVVRVRSSKQTRGQLRYVRIGTPDAADGVAGTPATRTGLLTVVEPGVPGDEDGDYLVQPPGTGGVWIVSAASDVAVVIERPVGMRGVLAWEVALEAALDWVDTGDDRPSFPDTADGAGSDLATRMEVDAELAASVTALTPDPQIAEALRWWRKASIVDCVVRHQPITAGYFGIKRLEDSLAGLEDEEALRVGPDGDETDEIPYRWLHAPAGRWTIELSGPGLLRVEARATLSTAAIAAAVGQPQVPLVVRLSDGAGHVERSEELFAPAVATVPPLLAAAFPRKVPLVTGGGQTVGQRSVTALPLLQGRHRYSIEVSGGPALLRIAVVRHRELLPNATRGLWSAADYANRALDKLRKTPSNAAGLVRMLSSRFVDGTARPPQADELPPLLRAVTLTRTATSLADWSRAAAGVSKACGAAPSTKGEPPPAALPDGSAVPSTKGEPPPAGLPDGSAVPSTLCWTLRLDVAEALAVLGDRPHAEQLVTATRGLPPLPLASRWARLIPAPDRFERMRDKALAATLLAWRERPTDPRARDAALRRWYDRTTWVRVPPASAALANYRPPQALTYLDTTVPTRVDAERNVGPTERGAAGGWPRLRPGLPAQVEAPPSLFCPACPAVLRIGVRTRPASADPVAIFVDDRRWDLIAVTDLEVAEIAVAPGPHAVRVEGAGLVEAYSSFPLAANDPRVADSPARLRRYWPTADAESTHAVRYLLPQPGVPGPVRVEVRVIERPGRAWPTAPIELTLKSDIGSSHTLVIRPDEPDDATLALSASGRVGRPLAVEVSLPTTAREIWLDAPIDSPIVAAIYVRGWKADGSVAGPTTPLGTKAPTVSVPGQADAETTTLDARFVELRSLSEAILRDGSVAEPRLRRARLLLDLAFGDLAREEIAALLTETSVLADRAGHAALFELLDEIEAASEPTHLPAQPTPSKLEGATALSPNLSGAGEFASLGRAVRAARTADATAALRELDSGVAPHLAARMRARLLARAGEPAKALDALLPFAGAGDWQTALEAFRLYERTLREGRVPSEGVSATVYGLASQLREGLEHPRVRGALALAATHSTWVRQIRPDSSGGVERLTIARGSVEPTPTELVREALVVAPWPARHAHLVRPGKGAGIKLDPATPTTVHAQVWCQALLGSPHPADEGCPVTLRVDARAAKRFIVPRGTPMRLDSALLEPGSHQVEVVHEGAERTSFVSVRFVADRVLDQSEPAQAPGEYVVAQQARAELNVVRTDRPATWTVASPTTVRVEARRAAGSDAAELVIVTRATATARELQQRIPLDATPDPDARAERHRGVEYCKPTVVTLVLPDGGPHSIELRTSGPTVLARLAARQDKAGPALPAARPFGWQYLARPTSTWSWPTSTEAIGRIDARPLETAWTLGTLSVGVTATRESASEGELVVPRWREGISVGFRRELVRHRFWLRVEPGIRTRDAGDVAYRGDIEVYLQGAPSTYRLWVLASGGVQPALAGSPAVVRGMVYVDRVFQAGLSWQWLPALVGRGGYQRSTTDTDAIASGRVDPSVDDGFTADHPFTLTPRVAARYVGLQDSVGVIALAATLNSNFASFDRVDAQAQWASVLPVAGLGWPVARVSYRASLRLADAHRSRTYVRHDLRLRVSQTILTGSAGRILIEPSFGLITSADFPMRTEFSLSLRYDLTRGRGLHDMMPTEIDFTDLVARRYWSVPDRLVP